MLWSQTYVVLSTKDRLDWEAQSHDRDFSRGPEKPGAAQPVGRRKVPEVKTLSIAGPWPQPGVSLTPVLGFAGGQRGEFADSLPQLVGVRIPSSLNPMLSPPALVSMGNG